MVHRRKYDPSNKKRVFESLCREILAARLKVTLDEQLGRETSPMVKRLSRMKLPPIVHGDDFSGEARAKQERIHRSKYDPTNKERVFQTLRREILAARLKVTLDEQLGRET